MNPWILAARPRTLPAAVVPVVLGTAVAWQAGGFRAVPALICLGFALLIQIGANYANDYYDFIKGADTPERIGPTRAVAAGLIPPPAMKRAMIAVFAVAFGLGLALIPYGGWQLLAVGVASVICGIAYTGGPFPLGYHGLGDVFVFLFFGIVAVNFTSFVQTGSFSLPGLVVSLVAGGLTTNLLVVNNYRDAETDARAGKKTLAVRFGRPFTLAEYRVNFGLALVAPLALLALGLDLPVLAAVVVWPLCARMPRALRAAREGPEYNALLGKTARFLVIYGFTLAGGIAFA